MSQHWAGFIDQTLHSTNDTIRRLRERQAHYDAAKKRVREAFGNAQFTFSSTTSHVNDPYRNDISPFGKEGRPTGSSAHTAADYTNGSQLKVPPPLPPSVIDYSLFGEETHARLPLGNSEARQPSHSPLARGSHELRDLTDAYRMVETRLKNVTVELELERTIRKDRERELSDRFSNQIYEMKASLEQLKMENGHLKDSVRNLETRQVLGNTALHATVGALSPFQDGAAHPQSAFGANQILKDLNKQVPFRGVDKPYGSQIDASLHSAGAGSDHLAPSSLNALFQRVADLETSLLQQRRTLESRQQRMDNTIHEAIDNKMKLEIERVRSVAREAACASTESLIQLRFRAVQSMFNEELRKVLESTGVARELSQENERVFRKWEQNWSRKWEGMEDRMRDVETFTKNVRESITTDLERSFKQDIDTVRQELTTLRRETQESRARLAHESASKMESSRMDVMSAVQSMLNEQQNQDSLVREAVVRRLIESAVQPLHAGLESAQHGLQSVRESSEVWFRQTTSRLNELEDAAQTQKLDVAGVQRSATAQLAITERIRTQLKECAEKQQQLDTAFQELHAAATESIEATQAQAGQNAEQRAQFDAQLRRIQQAQEGQSKRLHAIEATEDEHRQRIEQMAETVSTLEGSISRSLQPTTQKLSSLQQTVYQNCLPQIESFQREMLETTTRWQQLHDGRAYHEKLVGQLLVDAKKDSEARMQDLESRMRQDLDETRLRWKDNLESHVAALTPMARGVETLMTKVSLTEKTQNSMSESIQRLEANLAVLEMAASSNTDVKDTVSQAAATLLGKRVENLEMELRARESDEQLIFTTRLDRVDAEQLRLGQNVVALQDLLHEAVGKIKHEMQLQDSSLKEYAMSAVSKSEHRTLEHMNTVVQNNEERLKELILPSRLVQRVVMESSVLTLLAKSLLPYMGLSDERLTSMDAMPEALRTLERQQVDLKSCLTALKDSALGGEKKANASDNDGYGGALLAVACGTTPPYNTSDAEQIMEVPKPLNDMHLLLLQTRTENEHLTHQLKELQDELRHVAQQLKDQILQHRTTSEETTSSLIVKVAALEAQGASLTDTYSELHKWVSTRLQAAQEAWSQDFTSTSQQLRAGVRRLEESYTAIEENLCPLSEAVRKATTEGEQNCQALDELRVKLAGLEGLVVTRLEEVYRDMIEWHQNQLATIEQRLTLRVVEEDTRWKAFRDDMEQRVREGHDANASSTNPKQAKSTCSGDDAIDKGGVNKDRETGGATPLHDDSGAYTRVKLVEGALIALEQQLGGVATSSEVGLKATADALTGLRDSLQQCVSCVTRELQNDNLMMRIIRSADTPVPSLEVHSEGDTNENSASAPETIPKLEALDQVFVLLMRQLSYVCHGLATLQENAFATLELVQQQEMSILAIPTLQEAVLQLASQMRRVSMALPEVGEWDVGIEEVIQSTMLRPPGTVLN